MKILPAFCFAAALLLGIGLASPGFAAPAAPKNVSAFPGNQSVTLTWDVVGAATSYNVYYGTDPGVTTADSVLAVAGNEATVPGASNGTPYYFAVTANSRKGESGLSKVACAVPTLANTTGLTLYDALCDDVVDGHKWDNPAKHRGVAHQAMVLHTQAHHEAPYTDFGLNYEDLVMVNGNKGRVTGLQAKVMVPSAGAALHGVGTIRALVTQQYQPLNNRLPFAANRMNLLSATISLVDARTDPTQPTTGLRVQRRMAHCDDPSCTSSSIDGIAAPLNPPGVDPATGIVGPAAYDTVYLFTVQLDVSSGIITWTVDDDPSLQGPGGAGKGGVYHQVSGTLDPFDYLTNNADWQALPCFLPGTRNCALAAGFFWAGLGIQSRDMDASDPSDVHSQMTAHFQDVGAGFFDGPILPFDDFSGQNDPTAGLQSGPKELNRTQWGGGGMFSMKPTNGSLLLHQQITSPDSIGNGSTIGEEFPVRCTYAPAPCPFNTMQADVTVVQSSNTDSGSPQNVVALRGRFYNTGTSASSPPNLNQPNSAEGDILAALFLADGASPNAFFQIFQCDDANCGARTGIGSGSVPIPADRSSQGMTHTLFLSWDAPNSRFTFQVDSAPSVLVDPTTVNDLVTNAAPNLGDAHAPLRQIVTQLNFLSGGNAPGSHASIDVKVNNAFVAAGAVAR